MQINARAISESPPGLAFRIGALAAGGSARAARQAFTGPRLAYFMHLSGRIAPFFLSRAVIPVGIIDPLVPAGLARGTIIGVSLG